MADAERAVATVGSVGGVVDNTDVKRSGIEVDNSPTGIADIIGGLGDS